nr:hypothetical protein BaRGS_001340 [Batillaria attramentaria]
MWLEIRAAYQSDKKDLQQFRRVTVRTPLGLVSGRVETVLDVDVNQFLGVPYALPPTGQLRFRNPVPVQAWSNTLNATQVGTSWETSEDCLYLNIYARATPPGNNPGPRAVMVWVHGGGFVVGAGRGADGSLMAVRGDVVVVTVNYRLGMLGWMSTLDDNLPGNFGLWDQRTAFQWVRDNIAAFGGDPNQRVIMQSGSALNRRTIALDPVGFARRVAENLGCLRRLGLGFDSRFFADCARQRSVNDILGATSAASRRSYLAWVLNVAPVVDGQLIPEHPRVLLGPWYRGQVPFWNVDVMVGTTNAEGSLVLSPLVPFQGQLGFSARNGIPTRVLCGNISTALARDYFPQNSDAMAADLLYTARGGDAQQARAVVDLYGDMMFQSAAVETLLRHANGTAGRGRGRYQYLFSHAPAFSSIQRTYPWFQGAGHGAEVNFVFGMFMSDQNEARLSLAMIEGWTNFAKFGTPNDPQNTGAFRWPEYDAVNRAYTDLNLVITSQNNLYSQRMNFWMSVVPDQSRDVTTFTPNPQSG